MTTPNLLRSKDTFLWFDLDDTLWDMSGNSCIVLKDLFDADPDVRSVYGDLSLECWMDNYHAVNGDLWHRYALGEIDQPTLRIERFAEPLRMAGMDDGNARKAAARLDTTYLRKLGQCTSMVEGAAELLAALAADGRRMGIISNGFTEVQHNKLRSSGIENFFEKVILSDDVGVNKPSASFFEAAAAAAGVSPEQCVAIGDNAETDICGALGAGWAAAVYFNRCGSQIPQRLLPYLGRLIQVNSLKQLHNILF